MHLRSSILQTIQAKSTRDILSIDLIRKLPTSKERYNYVFSCLDVFSRFVVAYPIRSATTGAVLKCLELYFTHLGVPKSIMCDNGPCFVLKQFKEAMQKYNIKVHYVTPYHPSSSPVERIHREFARLWRVFCKDKHNAWPEFLVEIVLLINYSITESLGVPFEHLKLSTNEEITTEDGVNWNNKLLMADLRRKEIIRKRNEKHNEKDTRRKIINEGDLVFLRQYNLSNLLEGKIKKWFELYRGPYTG